MSRIERIYQIEQILTARRSATREQLLEALGVSRATLKRDLQYLRDRLNAPIEWDSELRGYRFAEQSGVGPKYQLPGLWFNEQELLALATMQHLLSSIAQDGPISKQLAPLMERLSTIVGHDGLEMSEIQSRVKLLTTGQRKDDLKHFKLIGAALVKRRRLKISYVARYSDKNSLNRELSPQRLIHYRNNWYLGAWCHQSEDIRTFSMDVITDCIQLETKAKKISEKRLNEYYDNGYGIYAGVDCKWAKLRFSSEAARYVAHEIWHTDQRSRTQQNGSYLLEVPYVMPQELIMDVLRHGAEVEVLGPAELRDEVKRRVQKMAGLYRTSQV